MKEKLIYVVLRGKNTGIELTPHKYADGTFKAYKTSSRNDPNGKSVSTESELISLVRYGYHIRMSNIDFGHSPSTVKPNILVLK